MIVKLAFATYINRGNRCGGSYSRNWHMAVAGSSPVKDSSESSVKSSTVTVAKQSLVESEKSFFLISAYKEKKLEVNNWNC